MDNFAFIRISPLMIKRLILFVGNSPLRPAPEASSAWACCAHLCSDPGRYPTIFSAGCATYQSLTIR
ncbi:hypothetical protein T11_1988 [Trichinella zimbabwensis]|uniref:Uncharacterized protein n=1 Tax=Trichinella zimbabwensis TaxID=268475 RepID=A0A0V1I9I0_9BILA|nr:hypothetical protein T11_1988 [Trichinella zimbabwensis]